MSDSKVYKQVSLSQVLHFNALNASYRKGKKLNDLLTIKTYQCKNETDVFAPNKNQQTGYFGIDCC